MNNTETSQDVNLHQNKQQYIKSRNKRNIAIGLGLFFFIILVYLVTIFKLVSQLFV